MPTRPRTLLWIALCSLLPATTVAQGTWVGHQDPCRLTAGHYLVSGGILYLKQAVESRHPDDRDGRLREAHRVLTEALTERGQENNPSPWYYLGRYYVLTSDPRGADSAFARAAELEATCVDEVAQYKSQLAGLPLNEALTVWGAGHPDSAAPLFQLAMRLAPDDAEAPLYTGMMYAASGQLDSADKYVALGVAASETDTAHGARKKQAQVEVARAYETRAYEHPAILRAPQVRVQRDSLSATVAQDSTHFATMVGQVNEIRARGRQLDPESQSAFERESTMVADRMTRTRAQRDSLATLATADSNSIGEVLAPAIAQYAAYMTDYPDDVAAGMSLARLYSAAGQSEPLAALIDQIASSPEAEPNALIQGGMTLYNEGQAGPAARILEAALTHRPYDRNGLLLLARSYYTLKDAARLIPVTTRLAEVDPLNSNTMRMIALRWVLAGNQDSVDHYVAMSDSGVGWHVNVMQFMARDNVTSLNGSIRNISARPLPPTTLLFEFLDGDGNVVFSAPLEVPAIEPRGRTSLSVRKQEGGAVAWRYRRQ